MSPSPMQQQQQQASGIIKATAKFQDTEEPVRQRPMMELRADNKLQVLPNTIRASIDSGRDNPFRPDGEIYKSADPIVDTYKFGLSQSRTQSPTDSQLLLKGTPEAGNGVGRQNEEAKSRKKNKINKDSNGRRIETDGRLSCWKRWFCCCCYGKQKRNEGVEQESKKLEDKKGCRWCFCC